jgi:hypothetical protein
VPTTTTETGDVIDGRSNSTTYEFDLFDRLRKTNNALNHHEELSLDKNGNVTRIDRKNSGGSVLLARVMRYYDQRNCVWQTSNRFRPSRPRGRRDHDQWYKTGGSRVTMLSPTTGRRQSMGQARHELLMRMGTRSKQPTTALATSRRTLKEVDASPVTHAFGRRWMLWVVARRGRDDRTNPRIG